MKRKIDMEFNMFLTNFRLSQFSIPYLYPLPNAIMVGSYNK
ncbi:MAG: hypothetical protein ACI83L_000813 [Cryomorphaceae bacterium]|jgi:hypothetical protein